MLSAGARPLNRQAIKSSAIHQPTDTRLSDRARRSVAFDKTLAKRELAKYNLPRLGLRAILILFPRKETENGEPRSRASPASRVLLTARHFLLSYLCVAVFSIFFPFFLPLRFNNFYIASIASISYPKGIFGACQIKAEVVTQLLCLPQSESIYSTSQIQSSLPSICRKATSTALYSIRCSILSVDSLSRSVLSALCS